MVIFKYKKGGENLTPAPTKSPDTTEAIARSTSWGRSSGDPKDNSSKQGYGGASSLNPGERSGPATVDASPTDAVKEALISAGATAQPNWQTRSEDFDGEQKIPTAFGMKKQQGPVGSFPAKGTNGAIDDNALARRNAMLRMGQGK